MVISHGDDDHIGGAYSILSSLPVNEIITSVPERFNSKAEYCSSLQNWQWDGVNFVFINPDDNFFSSNDASCVLKIDNGVNSVLLPGDIENVTEKWLVENKLAVLSSTVLAAPHHGSRTSSSMKFVSAVSAKYVLFPIGYNNRFNFPAKIVLKRYLQKNAAIFDTAKFGAITFKLNNKEVFSSEPLLYRKTNAHYWNRI
jgi:competence protein ComEC